MAQKSIVDRVLMLAAGICAAALVWQLTVLMTSEKPDVAGIRSDRGRRLHVAVERPGVHRRGSSGRRLHAGEGGLCRHRAVDQDQRQGVGSSAGAGRVRPSGAAAGASGHGGRRHGGGPCVGSAIDRHVDGRAARPRDVAVARLRGDARYRCGSDRDDAAASGPAPLEGRGGQARAALDRGGRPGQLRRQAAGSTSTARLSTRSIV